METLHGVGITRCRSVGLTSGVDLSLGGIGNGGGTLLIFLDLAVLTFIHGPSIVVNATVVFFSIYLFLVQFTSVWWYVLPYFFLLLPPVLLFVFLFFCFFAFSPPVLVFALFAYLFPPPPPPIDTVSRFFESMSLLLRLFSSADEDTIFSSSGDLISHFLDFKMLFLLPPG